MSEHQYFVTGIGTEVGKTVVSATLVKHFGAHYWKPVQAGELDFSDSHKVQRWSGAASDRIFPERYRLNAPMSPHAAARLDGVQIRLEDFEVPAVDGPLIVEGAGGLMVPLNDEDDLMIDLIAHLGLKTILVVNCYLGSINHTLLSVEALRSRQIALAGIVFTGELVESTREVILERTQLPEIGCVPMLEEVNATTIAAAAAQLS